MAVDRAAEGFGNPLPAALLPNGSWMLGCEIPIGAGKAASVMGSIINVLSLGVAQPDDPLTLILSRMRSCHLREVLGCITTTKLRCEGVERCGEIVRSSLVTCGDSRRCVGGSR